MARLVTSFTRLTCVLEIPLSVWAGMANCYYFFFLFVSYCHSFVLVSLRDAVVHSLPAHKLLHYDGVLSRAYSIGNQHHYSWRGLPRRNSIIWFHPLFSITLDLV